MVKGEGKGTATTVNSAVTLKDKEVSVRYGVHNPSFGARKVFPPFHISAVVKLWLCGLKLRWKAT